MAGHESLSVADLKDIQAGPVYALFLHLVFTILTSFVLPTELMSPPKTPSSFFLL
jgi:hypothetical protein